MHARSVTRPLFVSPSTELLMLKIREAGFNIVAQKDVQLEKETAESLYKNCQDKEYYGDLIEFMTRFV